MTTDLSAALKWAEEPLPDYLNTMGPNYSTQKREHELKLCLASAVRFQEKEIAELKQSLSGRTVSCENCNQTAKERDEALERIKRLEAALEKIAMPNSLIGQTPTYDARQEIAKSALHESKEPEK